MELGVVIEASDVPFSDANGAPENFSALAEEPLRPVPSALCPRDYHEHIQVQSVTSISCDLAFGLNVKNRDVIQDLQCQSEALSETRESRIEPVLARQERKRCREQTKTAYSKTSANSKKSRKENCQHGRQKARCKSCGGASICEHGRRKSHCKPCGGSAICEHGRQKSHCKPCGGVATSGFLPPTMS